MLCEPWAAKKAANASKAIYRMLETELISSGVPLSALNEMAPSNETTARMRRLPAVDENPVRYFAPSTSRLITNGLTAAKSDRSMFVC
jgi:hypothetical protein